MDTLSQVRNYETTRKFASSQPPYRGENISQSSHSRAVQKLSNESDVSYGQTLRVVVHEGAKSPKSTQTKTQKAVGYIRNESGGFFTS